LANWSKRRNVLLPVLAGEHSLPILVFPILAADSFTQLLESLYLDVETFGKFQFVSIIAKEDEGLQSRDWVQFLMNAP
jgi:hypothetical protein